jgi:hypothetical protein
MAQHQEVRLEQVVEPQLFEIADYERAYAWESKQLGDLWEDLDLSWGRRGATTPGRSCCAISTLKVDPRSQGYPVVSRHGMAGVNPLPLDAHVRPLGIAARCVESTCQAGNLRADEPRREPGCDGNEVAPPELAGAIPPLHVVVLAFGRSRSRSLATFRGCSM